MKAYSKVKVYEKKTQIFENKCLFFFLVMEFNLKKWD